MASIACTIHLSYHPSTTNVITCSGSSSSSSSSSLAVHRLSPSKFLGNRKQLGWIKDSRIGPNNNNALRRNEPSSSNNGGVGKIYAWFKFGKNGVDAEGAGIYGSQRREDYDRDDVEQYFNYMGMLAVEGTYDKMNSLLSQNIHPADILLLMAASEGDKPKIEELLRAGAKYNVKDVDGKTALERAPNDEIKDFIIGFSAQKA